MLITALSASSIKNLKTLKYCTVSIKQYFFLLFVINVEVKLKQYLKKEQSIEISKIPVWRNYLEECQMDL